MWWDSPQFELKFTDYKQRGVCFLCRVYLVKWTCERPNPGSSLSAAVAGYLVGFGLFIEEMLFTEGGLCVCGKKSRAVERRIVCVISLSFVFCATVVLYGFSLSCETRCSHARVIIGGWQELQVEVEGGGCACSLKIHSWHFWDREPFFFFHGSRFKYCVSFMPEVFLFSMWCWWDLKEMAVKNEECVTPVL